jgi:hypothetical protein
MQAAAKRQLYPLKHIQMTDGCGAGVVRGSTCTNREGKREREREREREGEREGGREGGREGERVSFHESPPPGDVPFPCGTHIVLVLPLDRSRIALATQVPDRVYRISTLECDGLGDDEAVDKPGRSSPLELR